METKELKQNMGHLAGFIAARPELPIKFTYPGTERIAVVMPVRLPE